MPFDGSGNYSRVHDWTSDRDNGIKIQAQRMDDEFDDIASALNVVFFRNGLVPMTGDLDMSTNDIKGIASGSAAAPSIQFAVDPNSGFYLGGASNPAMSVNGVKRFEGTATGVVVTGTATVNGALTTTGNITSGNNILATAGSVTALAGVFTSLTANGSGVWTAANDGAGSGLDADLLDGLDSSAFGQIAAAQTWAARQTINNAALMFTGTSGYPGNTLTGMYKDATSGLVIYGTGSVTDVLLANKNGATIFDVGTGATVLRFASTPTAVGNTMWHAGNDGAGSGLDADLLDGLNSSAFAQLASTNVFTAAIRAGLGLVATGYNTAQAAGGGVVVGYLSAQGYIQAFNDSDGTFKPLNLHGTSINVGNGAGSTTTFTNGSNTIWHAGNDGSGSGLDADLLDGLNSSAFAQLSGATFTGALAGTSLGLSGNATVGGTLGVTGTFTGGTGSFTSLTISGNTNWHAGNDGSGSGLDADLLDGLNSTAFAQLSGAQFTGNVGIGIAPTFAFEVAGAAVNFAVRSTDTNNATFRGYVNGTERGKLAFTNTGTVLIEANGTNVFTASSTGLAITGTLSSTGALTRNGNTVWDAANDGSGSGLDADLLDGLESRTILGIARTTNAIGTGNIGKCQAISAGVTVPSATFAAGDAISLYNDSAAAVTITQGAGLTQRLNGTATTGNLTLAARGFCTIWFNSASECIVSGAVS